MGHDVDAFIAAAKEAAIAAAAAIATYTPQTAALEHKADTTPVTAADRAAEQVLRRHLNTAFSEHAIWGEEYGRDEQQIQNADYVWLLDPIDGTKSWISQLPFWSIQIALRHRDRLLAGVSYAPALNELAWAAPAGGAWLNNERLQTSGITAVSDCRLSAGNLGSLAADRQAWSAYGEVLAQCNRIRGYGDYYHYHRLAAGQLDAVIESDVNILDIAALALLVEEAGGVFTDLQGAAVNLQTTSVLAAATAELHNDLLQQLTVTDPHA